MYRTKEPKRIVTAAVYGISIALILCLGPAVSHAAEISGVQFKETFEDNGVRMALQGTGLKRMFLFRAFAVGFYADGKKGGDSLGEFSKRIEVEYFVNIPAEKLNAFTIDYMKLNVSPFELARLQQKITLMGKYFVDLRPGDRFSLTYIPGVGTKFAHNDTVTGVIPGKDFAKAIFSVWLGERPFDPRLKDEIFGVASTDMASKASI